MRHLRWNATTSVAGVCLLLVLLYGSGYLFTTLTAYTGMTVVPSALGAPMGLPGLRAYPLGATTWSWQLCEDFAALLLIAVAVVRIRRHLRKRPAAGRVRRLLAGWTALIAGAAAAGAWRGLVAARMVESGALGWLAYAVAGALFGALWGLLLGWLPGAAVSHASGKPAAGGVTQP
ncbi:hypothetical protein [Streptomyces sp. NBC_01465]|uniref:hypothetical protein n=1 Tax=Streptomyces sp. NBC_01465 TaxID=2903878 RepID=UPI002E367981|nr:hypothetical protein [Streptomyces sp. NBC_01465]